MKIKIKRQIGILLLVSAVAIFTQCRKEGPKGWDFYYDEPSAPQIVRVSTVIKNCEAPYPVSFKPQINNLLGNMVYSWDFGDGNTSSDIAPVHIYQNPGDYTITLIVSNELGSDTSVLTLPELANASIPVVASFNFSHFNDNIFAPNKVQMKNNSQGANQFHWNFGDGQQSTDEEPFHVFNSAGTYNVKLRGTCTNGTEHEVSQQVLITSPPERIFIDSLNLMLPSSFKNRTVFVELWHNSTYVGRTVSYSGSFPVKFRRSDGFIGNSYFFDYVQFSNNEVFKFVVFNEGVSYDDPPLFLFEIALSSSSIKNDFYPRRIFNISTVPAANDVFIDLYVKY